MAKRKVPQFRDCVICGESFHRASVSWTAVTCSPECRAIRQAKKAAQWRADNPESYTASQLRYRPTKRPLERARQNSMRALDPEGYNAAKRAWRAKRKAESDAAPL